VDCVVKPCLKTNSPFLVKKLPLPSQKTKQIKKPKPNLYLHVGELRKTVGMVTMPIVQVIGEAEAGRSAWAT
jgi:hypothetical protein